MWISSSGKVYHLIKNGSGYKTDSIPFLGFDIGSVQAIYPDSNGITWFGGDDGLICYDSKVKKDYKRKYYCLVREVEVGEDSIIFKGISNIEQGITNNDLRSEEKNQKSKIVNPCSQIIPKLPYDLNSIKFQYAAPYFDNQEKVEYSYRLEGLKNDKWSLWSKETKANYTNLDDGEYTFEAKAKNVYGVESEVGEYKFEITPPFHRTWWFYGLQAGAMFLLMSGVMFMKKRYEVKKDRKYMAGTLKLASFTVTSSTYIIFEYLQYFLEGMLGGMMLPLIISKTLLSVLLGVYYKTIEKMALKGYGLWKEKQVVENLQIIQKSATLTYGQKMDIKQGEMKAEKRIVLQMLQENLTSEQIVKYTGIKMREVEMIAGKG